MKWIGQHIVDLIARFRSDVYLEDISTGTIASGAHLGLDSNNKIVKAADGGGDLTSIVAGTNLSGTDLSGPIPTINLDNPLAGPLEIEQGASGGGTALLIDNNDVDEIALKIDAANTTAHIIDINGGALTSGNAINVQGNPESDVSVILSHITDIGTGDGPTAGPALIEARAHKTGVVGATNARYLYGVKSHLTDTATNHVNSGVVMTAFTGIVDSVSTSGLNYNTGLNLTITDATYNTGVQMTVENGGTDIKMMSSANPTDYCTIATGAVGATTITTVDTTVGATAHFEIAADGDITLDSAGQIKLEPVAGNNILLDGTIAIDAGVVTGATSITSTSFVGALTGQADTVATIAGLAPNTATTQASQPNITGVGTIGTGVWQGTTIKTAYIGDDQVTEDKLADTLLAEIDANTAKVTNVATNLTATTHASQITINSSDGTNVIVAEASGSIAGVMSVTHHDKLDAIEASATADQSKSDIDGLAITTVGTIDTGVWNGTAIASDQQKHLMHYQVQGYSAGSTNYVASKVITDIRAPFLHSVDIGSDGLDAQTIQVWMRTGGHVMPNACTLKRFTGWTVSQGGASQTVALFRVRLEDDVDSDPEAVLLQEVTYTASANATANLFNVTTASSGEADDLILAAGDIVFSALKGAGNPTYFNGTFEVEF